MKPPNTHLLVAVVFLGLGVDEESPDVGQLGTLSAVSLVEELHMADRSTFETGQRT